MGGNSKRPNMPRQQTFQGRVGRISPAICVAVLTWAMHRPRRALSRLTSWDINDFR